MNLTDPNAGALLASIVLASSLSSIVVYVWMSLALARVFRKCGVEGWKAWVPFLNVYELLQLGGFNGWLVLLVLFPGLGALVVYVLMVMSAHRLNQSFGFGSAMTVLAALLFPVWATILGFGSARWLGHGSIPGGPVRGAESSFGGVTPLPAGSPYAPASAMPLAVPPSTFPPAIATSSLAVPGVLPVPPRPPLPVPVAPVDETPPAPAPAWAPPPPPPARATDLPFWVPPAAKAPDAADLEGVDDPSGEATVAESSTGGFHRTPEDDITATQAPEIDFAAPAPVSARSASLPESETDDSVAAPVTRVPAAAAVADDEPWAPRPETDAFPESSGEVSAIVGSPDAGEPRSALASVSALHAHPQIPEDEDELDETVIVRRKRPDWLLIPPTGRSVEITSDVVILGRKPAFDADFASAQLIPVDDDTRTISKTHARLELREDRWHVTDLGSTNGVMLTTVLGTEVEASPGAELAVGERFLLGDAELRLERSAE